MNENNYEETLADLFIRTIEIEQKLNNIYLKFSVLFSHLPQISAFWKELSYDEISHRKTLQNISNSLTQEQLLSPSDRQIMERVVRIENSLNKDSISSITNLNDAYELAHQLEFSEVNAVFKFLSTKYIPFKERSDFIESEITNHQQKLLDFGKKFGNVLWRKQISVVNT